MNFEAINQNFHGGNATTAYNLLEGRGYIFDRAGKGIDYRVFEMRKLKFARY